MNKYINAKKLITQIKGIIAAVKVKKHPDELGSIEQCMAAAEIEALNLALDCIKELQQEQPEVQVIQWTGHNLKEVIDFTGKSPRFGEWFKSWKEFESYVHSHGDILKLFSEDGSHFEVPVGAWIVKTPDGYNVPSVARFIHAKPELDLEEEIKKYCRNYYNCNYPDQIQNGRCSPVMTHIVEAARHFAEWGAIHLNARKEE